MKLRYRTDVRVESEKIQTWDDLDSVLRTLGLPWTAAAIRRATSSTGARIFEPHHPLPDRWPTS